MAAKFPDSMEIKALTAVLTPPPNFWLRCGLYENDNAGDPTLGMEQFFLSGLEGFTPKDIVFAPPATDGNSRAVSAADPITFTLGQTPGAPVSIYGFCIFYDDTAGTRILVAWEYFGGGVPFSVNGQKIEINAFGYCKDAEGVPA